MSSKIDAIRENYNKNLKADEYVDYIKQEINSNSNGIKNPLRFLYDVLQSGRFKGSKLLDLGCGPVVHNVALASAFYPNIIMSDYVEDLCEELKRWLKGQSTVKQLLEYPAEVEGYGGNLEAGKQLLEKRIKKCVKQVARGDILDDNIFLEEVKPEVAPPYDLIIAFWCIDVAPPDFEGFVLALKRIYKLLRPGGGLVFTGDFDEGKWWSIGEKNFHSCEVSENQIKEALKESGFKLIDMKVEVKDSGNKTGNPHEKIQDYYCAVAEKPSC